ncbi:MAG TPA: hypothetical protein DD422_01510 [Akkermansia sp.]|nr:hypothetical protein [Akkermansia sp.]
MVGNSSYLNVCESADEAGVTVPMGLFPAAEGAGGWLIFPCPKGIPPLFPEAVRHVTCVPLLN